MNLNKEKKTIGMFSKIDSRESALKAVKDTSLAFFFVAALQAAFSFVLGYGLLLDAITYAICAFLIRRFNSRAASIIVLIVATVAVGITIANLFGQKLGGGNNIILCIIIFWSAIRAVEATFKLRGRFSTEAVVNEQPNH
ncbi:hypothetical protein [Collimonas pratensis]|uniref:Uncharacterized protein n=1 Tax=Collimonas pratensis TaxID=279113 RepID=A0A127PYQ4_9BURK|nr:hypothetical protein [Collimonas pratensis]AMP02725.1 hypothetical protein CPter91_0326 [Collimonas pratensis]